jgi:hypothetical protein
MWLQRFTNYLLRHRWKAIALTFAITFVPIIGIVGILIAALITLLQGVVFGAIFTAAATLPFIISFYISGTQGAALPLVVWAAVGVAVLSNVLTWAFAVMLRRQASWSVILQIAALLGVLVISLVHLAYPGVTEWWATQLQSYYAQAQAVTGMLKNPTPGSSSMQIEAINATKQYATGLIVGAVLFNAILQLMVARWWQAIVFNPGSLHKELRDIRLSQLAGVLFVASLVFCYLGNSVVLDIMPVLYMLFGAAALSLIHYLFGLMKSPTRLFWLSGLYIILIFSLPMSIVLIAMIALADIWLDLRKRFKNSKLF